MSRTVYKVACGTTSCFADAPTLQSVQFSEHKDVLMKQLLSDGVRDSVRRGVPTYTNRFAKQLAESLEQDAVTGSFHVRVDDNDVHRASQHFRLASVYMHEDGNAARGIVSLLGDDSLVVRSTFLTSKVPPPDVKSRMCLKIFAHMDGRQMYSRGDMLDAVDSGVPDCKKLFLELQECMDCSIVQRRSCLLDDAAGGVPSWVSAMKPCIVILRRCKEPLYVVERKGKKISNPRGVLVKHVMKVACVLVFDRLPTQVEPITVLSILERRARSMDGYTTLRMPQTLHDLLLDPEHQKVFWGKDMLAIRDCVRGLPPTKCCPKMKHLLLEIMWLKEEAGESNDGIIKYFRNFLDGFFVGFCEEFVLAAVMGHHWHEGPLGLLPKDNIMEICRLVQVDLALREDGLRSRLWSFDLVIGDGELPWDEQ